MNIRKLSSTYFKTIDLKSLFKYMFRQAVPRFNNFHKKREYFGQLTLADFEFGYCTGGWLSQYSK